MLGSVTEGLLQDLPASLLVVPPRWRASGTQAGRLANSDRENDPVDTPYARSSA